MFGTLKNLNYNTIVKSRKNVTIDMNPFSLKLKNQIKISLVLLIFSRTPETFRLKSFLCFFFTRTNFFHFIDPKHLFVSCFIDSSRKWLQLSQGGRGRFNVKRDAETANEFSANVCIELRMDSIDTTLSPRHRTHTSGDEGDFFGNCRIWSTGGIHEILPLSQALPTSHHWHL